VKNRSGFSSWSAEFGLELTGLNAGPTAFNAEPTELGPEPNAFDSGLNGLGLKPNHFGIRLRDTHCPRECCREPLSRLTAAAPAPAPAVTGIWGGGATAIHLPSPGRDSVSLPGPSPSQATLPSYRSRFNLISNHSNPHAHSIFRPNPR
jgi:hypothetical protein